MKFLLVGEGSSDLGTNLPDGTLKKGAMTFLIDAISKRSSDNPLEYRLISESELKSLKKADRRNTMGRGTEHKPFEEIFLSAQYLGKHAGVVFHDDEAVGIIFFRDCDGTNAAPVNLWEMIVKAMQAGFEESGNKYGVPMVPRPKSEAWLMGYYQRNLPGQREYNHCERFEDMSGNDHSPNALKGLLKRALRTDGDVYDRISEDQIHAIQWERVDMRSLNLFRKRLENVLAAMAGSAYPYSIAETQLA